MNPAALAPFVDVFALGDGERLVPRIAELAAVGARPRGVPRGRGGVAGLLRPGRPGSARRVGRERGASSSSSRCRASEITPDFEVPHTTILTPRTELADKLLIEISRGCTEMCRFCWAAYAMAPVKQYPARVDPDGGARGARR